MSRIGKLPIKIPSGVQVNLVGNSLKVIGQKGELSYDFVPDVLLSYEDHNITVKPVDASERRCRSMWGLSRTLVANMVRGVSEGFLKKLEINGTGYKASTTDGMLFISLGFSHEIAYAPPPGIEIKCEKPTLIVVSGCDKQLVGQVAAEIRANRKPEPYKGKGVKYEGEAIRRKASKKK